MPEFGGYLAITALDGANDKFVIYDASGLTPEAQTRTVTPAALGTFMTWVTTSALNTALSSYVTSATLTSTLAGYFAKRVDGGLTATSTNNEHLLILNGPADDALGANVASVRHLANGGCSALAFLDNTGGIGEYGQYKGAVGYMNPSNGTAVFEGYAYLEGCNIDGGQPPGVELVQTGIWRGAYNTRPRDRTLPISGEREFYVPSTTAQVGARSALFDPRGNVAVGLPSLAGSAQSGFAFIPSIATAPTLEPDYIPGYVARAFCDDDDKEYVFKFNSKAVPIPTYYFSFAEATGTAPGDQVYNGPGRLAPLGGVITAVAGNPSGSGTAKRLLRASGQYYTQLAHAPDGRLTETFLLSMWVRPQTAFGYFCRLWLFETVLNVDVNSSGQVGADDQAAGAPNRINPSADTQLSLSTWSNVKVWRVTADKKLYLQVDHGPVKEVSYTGTPVLDSAVQPLNIGGNVFNQSFDGDMAEIFLVRDAAWTEDQRDSIYKDDGSARVFRWDTGWSSPTGGSGAWLASTAYTA